MTWQAIPTTETEEDANRKLILETLAQNQRVLTGQIGSLRERAITVGDLVDAGIITIQGDTIRKV